LGDYKKEIAISSKSRQPYLEDQPRWVREVRDSAVANVSSWEGGDKTGYRNSEGGFSGVRLGGRLKLEKLTRMERASCREEKRGEGISAEKGASFRDRLSMVLWRLGSYYNVVDGEKAASGSGSRRV
jgi:hypothetical protein